LVAFASFPSFASTVLSISPTSINFGSLPIGSGKAVYETLTNKGTTTITVTHYTISGQFMTFDIWYPLTLRPGASHTFKVKYVPTTVGAVAGKLTITSNAPTIAVPLSGTGTSAGKLTIAPTSINYGTNPVNSGPYQYVTLKNVGTITVNLSSVSITGSFSFSGITYPSTLAVGQSKTFPVKFIPKTVGAFTGTLSVLALNAAKVAVALSGSAAGSGSLTISPTSFSFGNVSVGTTSSKTATLTAGASGLTISGATTTNPEFTLSGLTLPKTIAAGQSISVGVNFKPSISGSTSAQISITSNAANSPAVVTTTGAGLAATQHTVGLTWSPSTSSVSGYNVYRGTTSGGPYTKLNGSSLVTTSYSDSTVQSGSTYFYVTTAVSSAGVESAKSNEVRAPIPTP